MGQKLNMFLTIYDKLVMPFYSMMQVEQSEPKSSRKLISILGYILSNNEDDEDREDLIERVMNEENAEELEHKV